MKTESSGLDTLGLAPPLVAAVTALGYEEATPVQREAIPLLLAGRDLIAQAATGTGKTAAFALPMIHRLLNGRKKKTRGLVLVPTRELAMQVAEAVHKYARGTGLFVVPLYGGASMPQQIRALERGVDIVVATPGRALDHLGRSTLDLSTVELVVLDEADEMLDMGFAEDIEAILDATPEGRQTALFSATMPPRLRAIAERQLRKPERIAIEHEKAAAGKLPRVRQVAYVVPRARKAEALQRVLDMESPASALVFCRTRVEVDTLVETLNAHGYRAEAIHGGMQQRQREAVMGRFRAAKADLLVATDVAARGLDISQLSHVFNYDVPSAPEAYIHRIGRTGRAGREGTAITLAEPRESRLLRSIERATRQQIAFATVPTAADLRARRLELTREALRIRLTEGKLDEVRAVVESLVEEFSVTDVAAAAVALVHAAAAGQSDAQESDVSSETVFGARHDLAVEHPARSRRAGERDRPSAARVFVAAGRRAGLRPGDLVTAIAQETGISARELGQIEISEAFALIEVPEALAQRVIEGLRKTGIRGSRVTVRLDRDSRVSR